jgi:HlyD family secretion protein
VNTFEEFIPVNGVVQPIKTVYLDAIESGKVEAILVEDGAMVQKGQVIMRLSNPDLQLTYLNQEAQIVSQINTIRNTSLLMEQQSLRLREQYLENEYRIDVLTKRLKRKKDLFNDEVIALVEYEETSDEFEHVMRRREMLRSTIEKDSMYQAMQESQMRASLDLMERNLKIARLSLENLIIRAPISGQLSSLDNELGELISKGARIAQIDALENFKIVARVDEFYINRIFVNQQGSFVFDGQQYHLVIKKIYPEVSNGTFEADLVFTEVPPETIKRGQTLTTRLSLSEKEQATLLARGSFFQSTGGNWVYVLDKDGGTAIKRDVRIGRQNPRYYEVLSGLQTGEKVIISSYETYGNKDILVLK